MTKASRKYLLILALAIVLAISLLVWTKPAEQADLKEILPTRVAVVEVQSRDITPMTTVTGRLQATRSAELHFEVSGQLVERRFEPGARVERGELLLRLAEGDFRDTVLEAEAALEQERAAIARDQRLLELAQREAALQARAVARMEQLGRKSLASRAERDESQSRLLQLQAEQARLNYSVATAEANLQQREASLNRAKRNLARTSITAPFDGIVNQVNVEIGDYVTPNTAVLQLLDTDQLDLYTEVSGTAAAALALGQNVSVSTGDETQKGMIVALQANPDPATFTHALRVRVPADGWLTGALAEAKLPLHAVQDALLIPISAVLQEEGATAVFVVEDGTLRRMPVTLGVRVGGQQVITSGLEGGESVVAQNVAALADGERVVAEAQTASRPSTGQADDAVSRLQRSNSGND